LFWDIDLLGSPQLYDAIPGHIQHIQNKHNAFEMYPCLYLCQEYTKGFKGKSKADFDQAWADATNLKVNSIEHFALATSTILCNKQHFLDIGAFDEDFIGHMGEDLELLNRLAISYGKFPFEADHCENWPSKVVSELKGFRKHFINYSVPHLEYKLFTAHLYHNTHIGSLYKKKNKKNLNLLLSKLRFSGIDSIQKKNENLLLSYLCTSPNLTPTKLQSFRRKTRKLFVNPILFCKDIN